MKQVFSRFLFGVYQFFRAVRYTLLLGVFGYVSHCKHSPSCGTYFWRCWQQEGLRGIPKGLRRLASCW